MDSSLAPLQLTWPLEVVRVNVLPDTTYVSVSDVCVCVWVDEHEHVVVPVHVLPLPESVVQSPAAPPSVWMQVAGKVKPEVMVAVPLFVVLRSVARIRMVQSSCATRKTEDVSLRRCAGSCWLWILALAACGRSPSQPAAAGLDRDGGDAVERDGGVPVGEPPDASTCGFRAVATDFALPTIPGAPASLAFTPGGGQASCATSGSFHYSVRDMDGDQQPDLVVDATCTDPSVGVSAWLVYPNNGASFAATATRFAIPPLSSSPGCAKQELLDVDGDLRPDLVVTSLCTDASVGTSRWIVYLNDANGFGAAKDFALPPGGANGAFASLDVEASSCATGNRPAYGVFDLDGDQKVDIVITAACDDPNIGTTSWRVHRGDGSGVAATPVTFALPAAPSGYPSPRSRSAACTAGQALPGYSMLDFDGDFKPDLVVTKSCTDGTVGDTTWLLYKNSGTAFATSPTSLALPSLPGAPSGSFESLGAAPACAGSSGKPGYATIDADGDFHPDLVVSRACADSQSGVGYWLFFRNTGGAFANGAELFALPSIGATSAAPLDFGGAAACSGAGGRPAFSIGSLAGQTLDLVVTAACNDSSVGVSRWLTYAAACP